MSTPARSYPKRSRQATGAGTYSTARRPRRSAGTSRSSTGGGGITTENNLGVAAQKYTKVSRAPMAPLDEPYFGSSPSASFEIPMWVRVEELTAGERARYDGEEKEREARRVVWRKELAQKTEEDALKKEGQEESKGKDQHADTVPDDATTNNAKVSPGAEIGEGAADPTEVEGGDTTMTMSGDSSQNESKSASMADETVAGEENTSVTTSNQPQEEDQLTTETEATKDEVADESATSENLEGVAEADRSPTTSQTEEGGERTVGTTLNYQPQEEGAETSTDEAANYDAEEDLEDVAVAEDLTPATPQEDGKKESEALEVAAQMDVECQAADGGNEATSVPTVVEDIAEAAEATPTTSQQDGEEESKALEVDEQMDVEEEIGETKVDCQ